jgi:hypothetical protein
VERPKRAFDRNNMDNKKTMLEISQRAKIISTPAAVNKRIRSYPFL